MNNSIAKLKKLGKECKFYINSSFISTNFLSVMYWVYVCLNPCACVRAHVSLFTCQCWCSFGCTCVGVCMYVRVCVCVCVVLPRLPQYCNVSHSQRPVTLLSIVIECRKGSNTAMKSEIKYCLKEKVLFIAWFCYERKLSQTCFG